MSIIKTIKNNRILTLVFSLAVLILLIALVGDKIIEYKITNWSETINERVEKTEKAVAQILNYKQQKLLLQKNEILTDIKKNKNLSEENLIEILTNDNHKNLVLAILDSNNNLIAWNKKFLTELKPIGEHHYRPNEVFFINTVLTDYLIVTDTIGGNTKLKLFAAKIVEKKYKLSKEYFKEISLAQKVSKKIGTDVEFNYIFQADEQKDGRKHSFELYNNYNNVIAQATFVKPSRAKAIKKLENKLFTVQSILILFGYFLLGLILLQELKNYKSKLVIFFASSFYLIVFRYLLVYLQLPKNIFTSELLNETYYTAKFGYGIAASPIDLGITFIIVFIISYLGYKLALTYFYTKKKSPDNNAVRFFEILFFVSIVYAFAFRGFSAAIRGIIFDSTIRYFQSITLTPTLPQFVMHINLLIFGVSFILFTVTLVFLILRNKPDTIKNSTALFLTAAIFLLVQLLFTFLQIHPLSNLFIKFSLIVAVFVFTYFIIKFDVKRVSKIISFFIIGSVLAIVSLLNFNTELERESLKSIAGLITRANEDWYKKIITESLSSSSKIEKAKEALKDNLVNIDKYAFLIWSNSKLQKESINSSVNFISIDGELIGGFGSVYPKTTLNFNKNIDDIYFIEESTNVESEKIIRGIKPITENNKLLGYLDITVLSDINDLSFDAHPRFISSGKLNDIAILSLNKIKILDYQNGVLKNIYGEVNPSDKVNDEILNADYSKANETWLDVDFNSGKHLIFAKKIKYKNLERILAVGLRNKDLSFSLFDFFKIFFSHSMLLLLILLIVIGILLNKRREYLFDLRTQLLISFLIISLLPLILLALYFRNLTEEKNDAAIYYKLGKRAFSVENYINEHTNNILDLDSIFVAASRDLNINYSIFDNNRIIYSSQDLIYDVDLIPSIPHPQAYKKIFLNGFQEVLVKDAIDKFKINTFYYKADILNKQYIVKVTDAFNKILLPLSGTEVDVFLFGTYSLAVIFIIMLSAYLANRISAPIRKLTQATKSIASGDLNLEIETDAKAEIKELVEGFQYMVKEIKKNQAMLAEIEREEAWKEMAKQVAHEIKNPLTPMKLSIQQLVTAYNDKSEKFDSFFTKVTTMLLNQIETLKNIATEFSNFARMPKLKVEKINCNQAIKQSLNLFTDEEITLQLDTDLPNCIIDADAEQFKRTLINLIRNSIQAGATKIIFTLSEESNNYILKISDNGKGIKKEFLGKIFEPNFTTKQEGMGLGLSMARRYFNSTGGTISIEETSPNGTTIKIILPKG
jgi:signal transduction histidine kinase